MDTIQTSVKVRMVKVAGKLKVTDDSTTAFESWKKGIPDGQVVEALFQGITQHGNDMQRKYFHALRDKYAAALGMSKVYAKEELCCLFGVAHEEEAADCPPGWHTVEIWGQVWYRKSLLEYSKRELYDLIEGTRHSCNENSIDVSMVVEEYS